MCRESPVRSCLADHHNLYQRSCSNNYFEGHSDLYKELDYQRNFRTCATASCQNTNCHHSPGTLAQIIQGAVVISLPYSSPFAIAKGLNESSEKPITKVSGFLHSFAGAPNPPLPFPDFHTTTISC